MRFLFLHHLGPNPNNISLLNKRERRRPAFRAHALYLLCVFLPFPFANFRFPCPLWTYQKSCIVGRPTLYIILPIPDSEFIPLEAHTVLVLSGHTYFLPS